MNESSAMEGMKKKKSKMPQSVNEEFLNASQLNEVIWSKSPCLMHENLLQLDYHAHRNYLL